MLPLINNEIRPCMLFFCFKICIPTIHIKEFEFFFLVILQKHNGIVYYLVFLMSLFIYFFKFPNIQFKNSTLKFQF